MWCRAALCADALLAACSRINRPRPDHDWPTVLAFLSREWDPTRPHQRAYLESMLGGTSDANDSIPILAGHDVYGERAAQLGILGEQALVLLDESGREVWRHVGAPTPGIKRGLAAALAGLTPSHSAEDASGARSHPSRREFVASAAAAAIITMVTPMLAHAESVRSTLPAGNPSALSRVTLNVNGRDVALDIESRVTLLDALREYAGMTGT